MLIHDIFENSDKAIESYGSLRLVQQGHEFCVYDGDTKKSSHNEMSNDYALENAKNDLHKLAKKQGIKAPAPKPFGEIGAPSTSALGDGT